MSNKKLFARLPTCSAVPVISKSNYESRLSRLWQQMADNSVCILVSNPECTRSNDTRFSYRQSSEIVYLNGFPEPDSVLIITKFGGNKQVTMLVQQKDLMQETWHGIRFGVEGAKNQYLADEAHPIANFEQVVGAFLKKAEQVYYSFGSNSSFDKKFRKLWKENQKPLFDPKSILNEMRLFKDAEELNLLRHAADVSAEAHKQAMLSCRPGVGEFQLQAVLEFVFKAAAATAPAYGTIVASGSNACVLHYVENTDIVQDGQLVLIDAGAEFGSRNGGYAADITRTFPANGKFSEAQKELYELVLSAQVAAINAAKPGARLIHVHEAAKQVLLDGLKKLGLLGASSDGKGLSFRDFMPHGTSHWLGIDVHDVGDYNDKNDSEQQSLACPKRRILEPGMVLTIEPGLYIKKDEMRVPARYRGIGIRIEDDIVITSDGNEVLTAAVPKSVAEIESLMSRR